jgi:tubulin epsilon
MRFEGKLNIDLNEITSNLVPYPQMHFLVPSLSPIQTSHNIVDVRNMNQLFNDLTARDGFLIDYDLNKHTQLAMSLMIRGDISLSEAQFYSEKIKKRVRVIR